MRTGGLLFDGMRVFRLFPVAVTVSTRLWRRCTRWVIAHPLSAVLIVLGVWNLLPWLAPMLMHLGWEKPAHAIYTLYLLFCHQLPQRSWFLFGPEFSYTREEILLAWRGTTTPVPPLLMRAFIGNPDMGWKVAWSDRMVSFYGGWFLFGLFYVLVRPRWRGHSLGTAVLLMLPLALDGGTHMLSDLGGLREGFRETNAWLAALTGHALPATFYVGDQWGSFNSLARLVTGLLAAWGVIGFAFPYLDRHRLSPGRSNLPHAQVEDVTL